jgi:hypothetical protein
VKYESPTTNQSKVKTKVIILKEGQTPRSWYQMKGLDRRNTYVKYESPSTYQLKVITKVKVFADGRTDR